MMRSLKGQPTPGTSVQEKRRNDELDDALDDSFPASDPPAPAQPHPDRWFPKGEAPAVPEEREDRDEDAGSVGR